jgi:arylsulfatase A-like enzyme
MPEKPNLLIILSDQQRRDSLGCYGNPVIRTPNLDRLAAEGVVCDQAFVANMVCAPSRASIWTGRYPRAHGVVSNGVALSKDEITIASALLEAGYRTASCGALHLSPSSDTPENDTPESRHFHASGQPFPSPYHGFETVRLVTGLGDKWGDYHQYLIDQDPDLPALYKEDRALTPPTGAPSSWKCGMPEEHHCTTWVADEAIKSMQSMAGQDAPFLLSVGFLDPHFPFAPPAPWCDMYDPANVVMPNRSDDEMPEKSLCYQMKLDRFVDAWPWHPTEMPEAHIREIIAHYYGMVSMVDYNVGRILAGLDELGLSDNTIVLYSTDHGEHLGDHWLIYKCMPYDECTHVPMIWRCPEQFATGSRIDGLVSHIDIMPTMLELAGVPVPHGVQGQSYATGLQSGEFAGRPYILCEDDNLAYGPNVEGQARTLRTPQYRLTYFLPGDDGELYDLEKDPNEFYNRWDDPEYAPVRNELIQQLLGAVIAAADPKPRRVASF